VQVNASAAPPGYHGNAIAGVSLLALTSCVASGSHFAYRFPRVLPCTASAASVAAMCSQPGTSSSPQLPAALRGPPKKAIDSQRGSSSRWTTPSGSLVPVLPP